MPDVPALNFESDYKTIQKAMSATNKAAEGARDALRSLMATVYTIGLKYEADATQIDAKLYEMKLGPAPGEKKRGKASPFWSKMLKLTFAQKTDSGWELPKEDTSRISKYGKMLTNAESAGVEPDKAKEYFSAGLMRRIAGPAGTQTEDVTTPSEQVDEAVKIVRDALSGLTLNVPIQDVLRAVIKAERAKVSKPKEGESPYVVFGEIADRFAKFISPHHFAKFSTEGGALKIVSSFNEFDSNQLTFECQSPGDQEWNFILGVEGLKLLKNLARHFANEEWETSTSDWGTVSIFAKTDAPLTYKPPKNMRVAKGRVGFDTLRDEEADTSFKEPEETWDEVEEVDPKLLAAVVDYGVIDRIEECDDLIRFTAGDWVIILPKTQVVEGEAKEEAA